MAGLLFDRTLSPAQQRALAWLQQQGVQPDYLLPLSGYTNHVFLVEQSALCYPQRSVLRLADSSLSADLCPMAHQFDAVLQRHIAAADLYLAPAVIAADGAVGAMWLDYAGKQKSLRRGDYSALRGMLAELYASGLEWGAVVQTGLREMLEGLFKNISPQSQLENLLQQAEQRGYFDYPLIPIHGDLNPGNLLHDGKRWWLIDWDFSGMQCREWDLAGLIVEHDWGIEQAQAFAPEMARADIKWFCSCLAILSWYWHVQRGSELSVITNKAEAMHYWITLRG